MMKIAFKSLALLLVTVSLIVAPSVHAQRPALDPADVFIEADTDSFDPGLPIGASFPQIRALYQGQEISDIDRFIGEKGAVFLAQRSVDWCPFCRLQLGELQDHVEAFEAAGIGLVVITYDAPELQQQFIDAGNITYPFLSDIDAATMITLGVLNEDYSPGERAYGIPHPGAFVVNPDKEIVGKIFVESFRVRVEGAGTLEYALEALE